MFKKIFIYISIFFMLFLLISLVAAYKLYRDSASYSLGYISESYSKAIHSEKNRYLSQIEYALKQKLQKEKKSYKKREIDKSKKQMKHIVYTIKAINSHYKKEEFFLLANTIFRVHHYKNFKIVDSKERIRASFFASEILKHYNLPCDALSNNGECGVGKNGIYFNVLYIPEIKSYLVGKTDIKFGKNTLKKIALDFLINIPDAVVYNGSKLLKGEISSRNFYIFKQVKNLDVFYGTNGKLDSVEKSLNKIGDLFKKNLKNTLLSVFFQYIFILAIVYIMLHYLFRHNLKNIENLLLDYKEKSIKDSLTSLLNREGFYLNREKISKYTFIIADLDNFKYINDTFGHEVGDKVLKEFSSLLKNIFKNSYIFRWGGDEFLICGNFTKKDIIEKLKTINEKLTQIQKRYDKNLSKKLSCSMGGCGKCELSSEDKFRRADLALYKVKKSKKGAVLFYSELEYIKFQKEDLK